MVMRRIMTLRHLSGLLLLQLVLAAQPVPGQDVLTRDTPKIEKFHFFPPPADGRQRHDAAGQFLPDIWTGQKPIWTSPVGMNHRPFFLPPADDKQPHSAAGLFLRDVRTDQKPIWTSPVSMNRRQFFPPPADDKQPHSAAGQFLRDVRTDQKPIWTSPVPTNRRQLLPPPTADKQPHSAAGQFLRDIWTDQKAIWTSPFRMNRHQFFTIALPLTAATAGLIATDPEAMKLLPNTPDQIRWSKRFADFGAIYTLGFLTGGWLIGGKIINKPEISQVGRNSAEALVNAVLVNYALKGITLRERPDQGTGDGRFWAGGQSFPSGHAMNSWAVAVAVARTPKCPKWLAITSYGMATAISLSRWSARRHFPSDILVGGVFGGLIGNYVARRPR
jgi:membrane-associated phospholipid phosphatase